MKSTAVRCIMAVLAVGSIASMSQANEKVYQQVLRSTVCVFAGQRSGAGSLIDVNRRLVVTNFHVVDGFPQVSVFFAHYENGKPVTDRKFYIDNLKKYAIKAKVTAWDPRRDLALLELESLPEPRPALELAAESAHAGLEVHSVGNPGASQAFWVYTSGTVRQVYQKKIQFPNGLVVDATVVETQSPVNPGDSGGPVVNDKGELVGVTQSVNTGANLVSNCIDVSELKDLLAGRNKSIDPHVLKLLPDLKLIYTVTPSGAIRLNFKGNNDKDPMQSVYIEKLGEKGKTAERLNVATPFYVSAESVPSEVAYLFLEQSARWNIGAWELQKVGKQYLVVFRAKLPADAPLDLVQTAIQANLGAARDIRPKFQSALSELKTKNSAHPSTLDGNWALHEKDAKQAESAMRLTFSGTSFVLHAGALMEMKGTYRFVDDTLTLTVGNDTLRKGKVRWMNNEKFILEASEKSIEFQKAPNAEKVAAAPAT
jgi:serine protease Do